MCRIADVGCADLPTVVVYPRPTIDSRRGAEAEPDSTAPESGKVARPEAVHAAALFLAGRDPAAIVLELRGISSKASGSRY